MKKKCLAIGIILLFIGIAVAPSINFNVVKASNDNDSVEVTTQACGCQGFGDTTVKLTRQQYQNLEQYLIDFRARLNQTTTREEAVPIFKEAVAELNKYGLLPKGMSVERVQKIIIGKFLNEQSVKHACMLWSNYKKSINPYLNYLNIFCFIFGKSTNTYFFGYPFILPIKLISVITFGRLETMFGNWHYYPAQGFLSSIGLLGSVDCDGPLHGGLLRLNFGFFSCDIGVLGFTGIKLGFNGNNFYFGFALLEYVTPYY